MNVYSVDIKICATAYIKAESEEKAIEIANREFAKNSGMELPDNLGWLEMPITGLSYDSPDLPDVSLSPAMTFYGPFNGDEEAASLVEMDVPAEKEPRKLMCMVSSQGTACPETVLLVDTPEERADREARHCRGGPDDPVPGSWIDASDNEAVIDYVTDTYEDEGQDRESYSDNQDRESYS
jgi:hypothetical protein